MPEQYAKDLSIDDAKLAVLHITEIIDGFVSSINTLQPGKGYDVLSDIIKDLNQNVQNCSGPFLTYDIIDNNINLFLETFTKLHPNLEKNLTDFFKSHIEITKFLSENPGVAEYKLLAFNDTTIEKIREIALDLDSILIELQKKNCNDRNILRGLFSGFSSLVETTEKAFLEEFISFRNKINQYSVTQQMGYVFPYSPVKIFGVRQSIPRTDKPGKEYTESRAIRHLLDHDWFKIDTNNGNCNVILKSPLVWNYNYDKVFSCQEFCNYVSEITLFYRTITNILFTIQLLGVLRQKFAISN